MKTKPPTENTGASIERAAIKAHCKRLIHKSLRTQEALYDVIAFIDSRTKRTAKRKGGLGKR